MEYLSVELQALIVFFSEIVFLYLKTINIKAVSKGNTAKAILSNSGISIAWLIGVTISVNSILNGNLLPILAFLAGGAIGTFLAMNRGKTPGKDKVVSLRNILISTFRLF